MSKTKRASEQFSFLSPSEAYNATKQVIERKDKVWDKGNFEERVQVLLSLISAKIKKAAELGYYSADITIRNRENSKHRFNEPCTLINDDLAASETEVHKALNNLNRGYRLYITYHSTYDSTYWDVGISWHPRVRSMLEMVLEEEPDGLRVVKPSWRECLSSDGKSRFWTRDDGLYFVGQQEGMYRKGENVPIKDSYIVLSPSDLDESGSIRWMPTHLRLLRGKKELDCITEVTQGFSVHGLIERVLNNGNFGKMDPESVCMIIQYIDGRWDQPSHS